MRGGGLWRRIKRALGLDPPDEEPALVLSGPPRRPLGASSVALELPDEPQDTDARGHDLS